MHEKRILERIISVAEIQDGDKVFEIGPGLGALTEYLQRFEIDLQLFELDRDMIDHIRTRWPDISLTEGDACSMDWSTVLQGGDWKCVSNLPYNVGTGIVTDLITRPQTCRTLTVMLQLEVAKRMVAEAGDRNRGSLSVFMECFSHCDIAFRVPRGAFSPPPNVESAVIQIELHSQPHVPIVKKTQLENLLSALFSQPRKTIRNCLKSRYSTQIADQLCSDSQVDPKRRPSTLHVEEIRNMLQVLGALGAK